MVVVPVLAHAAGGSGLPLSPAGIVYLGMAAVVLTTIALRVNWTRPRLGSEVHTFGARPATWRSALVAGILGAAGLVVETVLIVAAFTSDPSSGASFTAEAVFFVYWVGVVLASAVIGEAATWWCPWLGLARFADRLRGRDRTERGPQLWWLAPVSLWSLLALWLGTDFGGGPRVVGWWLVGHACVFGLGGVLWGGSWVRDHEPFVALSRTVGGLSPIGRTPDGRVGWRRPLSGLAAGVDDAPPAQTVLGLAAVMIGVAVFTKLRLTLWWRGHVLNRSLVVSEVVNVWAVAWLAVLAGTIWGITSIWAARMLTPVARSSAVTSEPVDLPHKVLVAAGAGATGIAGAPGDAARTAQTPPTRPATAGRARDVSSGAYWLAWGTVPIAVAMTAARFIDQFAVQIQDVIALASDPFSRGWDLFGTIDMTIHLRPFSPAGRAWTQLAFIVAGFVVALVVTHDQVVALRGTIAARRVQPVLVTVLGAAFLATAVMLLGL